MNTASTNLIRHFWENNRDEVVAKSYLNCHTKNMHSVMLLDRPGQRIRMFYADRSHDLYTNDPNRSGLQSLGYHQHHCDLTIQVIHGVLANHTLVYEPKGAITPLSKHLSAYLWRSPILETDKGGFLKIDEPNSCWLGPPSYYHCNDNQYSTLHLDASTFHTVSVAQGESAAWLVFEGREWPEYKPVTLSNNCELDKAPFVGFYTRPTAQDVHWILERAIQESLPL